MKDALLTNLNQVIFLVFFIAEIFCAGEKFTAVKELLSPLTLMIQITAELQMDILVNVFDLLHVNLFAIFFVRNHFPPMIDSFSVKVNVITLTELLGFAVASRKFKRQLKDQERRLEKTFQLK